MSALWVYTVAVVVALLCMSFTALRSRRKIPDPDTTEGSTGERAVPVTLEACNSSRPSLKSPFKTFRGSDAAIDLVEQRTRSQAHAEQGQAAHSHASA